MRLGGHGRADMVVSSTRSVKTEKSMKIYRRLE
jgi:hypothetical protein